MPKEDSDRRLLELAALAAGIQLTQFGIKPAAGEGDGFIGFMTESDDWKRGWFDPLTDDGDAFRLAVKLDMVVTVNRVDEWTQVKCGYSVEDMRLTNQNHNGDPYAATRRAIVRAAAEIVHQMLENAGGTNA